MPKIRHKNDRRYRIQFTLSRDLYQSYQALQERANRLHVIINYGEDFESWFGAQLEKAGQELQRLESKSQVRQAVVMKQRAN
jgi:hypothetical protein